MKLSKAGRELEITRENRRDKTLIVPSNISCLENFVINSRKTPSKFIIPSTVSCIGIRAFSGMRDLKTVIMEDSEYLSVGSGAFKGCKKLKTVKMSNCVRRLEGTFSECYKLKKFDMPTSLRYIGDSTFYGCRSLRKLDVPDAVERIGYHAFGACMKLKKIKLPQNLSVISHGAFDNCHKIRKIKLPPNVKEIEECAFFYCNNLRKINLPDSITTICSGAFNYCENLRGVRIPNKLKAIKSNTFANCKRLKTIVIPDSVESIEANAFERVNNVKEIKLSNIFQLYLLPDNLKENMYYYFNEKTHELIIAKNKNKRIKGYKKIDYYSYCTKYGCSKDVAVVMAALYTPDQIRNMGSVKYTLNGILMYLNHHNYKEVLEKVMTNGKEYKRLIDNTLDAHDTINFDIYRLAYALGIFSDNQVERQKACEFIINAFDKGKLNYDNVHMLLESLSFAPYNKEFAEFFMNKNNFSDLLEMEKTDYSGIIGNIHRSFEEIKEFGRSNRGNQRYRKVTIDMCLEYFLKVHFGGITEETTDIAEELAKHTNSQEAFDNAKEIREESIRLQQAGEIDEHILTKELFSKIEELKEDIVQDSYATLDNLNKLSNSKFSFEFLSKYDPKNFTLGKYCYCCAHIEGAGYGIMKASIVHPDCQNLIIRNKLGDIVAKSTLYVNREKGYGLFNNVEVSRKVSSEDDRQLIYLQYIRAVNEFVKEYNKRNTVKLKQVNVGMGLNDLRELIEKNHRESNILKGIDFFAYGSKGLTYAGDWQNEQYTLYKEVRR